MDSSTADLWSSRRSGGGRWGHIKETADESPNSEAEGRPGVFEGAQPLHQAPWGAAAVAAGENGGTQKETARCCLLLRGPWGT